MSLAIRIAADLTLPESQVAGAIALLDDGNTVPFIARYRKEATGSLTDAHVEQIARRLAYLRSLDERKALVARRIEGLGKLTPEVAAAIDAARTKVELEDLYLPFRPKRKTRAAEAIARGLEPLADLIWAQGNVEGDSEVIALPYVSEGRGVPDAGAAWNGARDIVAERVAEQAAIRRWLREFIVETGVLRSRVVPGKEADGPKYRDYFSWEEAARTIPSHRFLAARRGEAEGILRYALHVDRDKALGHIRATLLIDGGGDLGEHFHLAIEDAYDRLLSPSIEKEVRRVLRERAEGEAIHVFGKNLRALLMSPPLGPARVLGVDPGLRTGCKLAVIDEKGDVLATTTIHPHAPHGEGEDAATLLRSLLAAHGVAAVAVGNGTGGREADALARQAAAGDGVAGVHVVLVSEAGASVYSASELARREFPDLDVTLRGAVSIARRLQDPLAELVKIEPKSIGVGQYQHDVSQTELAASLTHVVESCVNAVGVDLNTASPALLAYVAGIGPAIAESIVAHRAERGPFTSRRQLLDVPGLGPKTFEQAAGFLRVRGGDEPLDASAVHPERYDLVARMAGSVGADVAALMTDVEARRKVDLAAFVGDGVGEPTLRDILDELEKPGRDPRSSFEPVHFRPDVTEVSHLQKDQVLEGVVTNVTAFGAFVDVGVHQDGLVHVSELSHQFVKDPSTVVQVGQRVTVKVLDVDRERTRISLSIKAATPPPPRPRPQRAPRRPERPAAQPRTGDRSPGDRPAGDRPAGETAAKPDVRPDARPPRPPRRPAPDAKPGADRRPSTGPAPRRDDERRAPQGDRRPPRRDDERRAQSGPRTPPPRPPQMPREPPPPKESPFSGLVMKDGKLQWKEGTGPKRL
jgi:uncharacterized protein